MCPLFVHGLALICEPDHPGDAASLPNTATSTFVCVAGACAVECVSYARLSLVPFDDVYDVSVGVACVAQVASKYVLKSGISTEPVTFDEPETPPSQNVV